jgi:hypothetical protein
VRSRKRGVRNQESGVSRNAARIFDP